MTDDNKKAARAAGIWWLLFMLLGPVSYLVADGRLLVPGNASASLGNIAANRPLFWAGAAAFFAGYVCFLLLAAALRRLFRPVSPRLCACMLGFVLVGTAIVTVGKVGELVAAQLRDDSAAARLLSRRETLEMAGELLWGAWLLPLVALIFKSGLLPRAVGWALIAAALYHIAAFAVFFISGTDVSANPALTILGLGEIFAALWLAAGDTLLRRLKKAPRG